MKARKYFSLIGQFDAASPFEVIFGDYCKDVVVEEQIDVHEEWENLFIIKTGDKQEDIEDRLTALNNGWSEVNRKRAERIKERKAVTNA